MSGCARVGRWHEVFMLLNAMEMPAIECSSITHDTVILACSKSGQWTLALDLLCGLLPLGQAAGVSSVAVAMAGCEQYSLLGAEMRVLGCLGSACGKGVDGDTINVNSRATRGKALHHAGVAADSCTFASGDAVSTRRSGGEGSHEVPGGGLKQRRKDRNSYAHARHAVVRAFGAI